MTECDLTYNLTILWHLDNIIINHKDFIQSFVTCDSFHKTFYLGDTHFDTILNQLHRKFGIDSILSNYSINFFCLSYNIYLAEGFYFHRSYNFLYNNYYNGSTSRLVYQFTHSFVSCHTCHIQYKLVKIEKLNRFLRR